MSGTASPLLAVDGLETRVHTRQGSFPAVDGVSLALGREETLAVVGESGCGKSMLALSVMRLLARNVARVTRGSVRLEGRELLALPERAMQAVRGREISMVFQEPMTTLNPVLTVGRQIAEVVRRHERVPHRAAWDRAVEMLALVRVPDPRQRASAYPHQLSGGMRQRVVIAMALACRPKVLLADEPTTALDVTIQAQILELIRDLQERMGMALMLITHDLGVVAETAGRVIVMYAGRKVEEAASTDLFRRPGHPYTRGLLRSLPRRLDGAAPEPGRRLREIPGNVPALSEARTGCLFAARCAHAVELCRREAPALDPLGPGHTVACWRAAELLGDAR